MYNSVTMILQLQWLLTTNKSFQMNSDARDIKFTKGQCKLPKYVTSDSLDAPQGKTSNSASFESSYS